MGRFALAVIVVGLASCAGEGGPYLGTLSRPPQGCLERRVVVGRFGADEWARHFELALASELRDEGFTVVREPAPADLVVSGQITTTAVEEFRFPAPLFGIRGGYRRGSQPSVSIEAQRPSGEPVWSHYYTSTKEKTLADWAEEAAEDLWKACQRQWRP